MKIIKAKLERFLNMSDLKNNYYGVKLTTDNGIYYASIGGMPQISMDKKEIQRIVKKYNESTKQFRFKTKKLTTTKGTSAKKTRV